MAMTMGNFLNMWDISNNLVIPMDGWTDGRTDGWMDGWKQSNSHHFEAMGNHCWLVGASSFQGFLGGEGDVQNHQTVNTGNSWALPICHS